MDEANGLRTLLLALARMEPPSADDCTCCHGETEGNVNTVCDGCYEAITQGDRDSHPHPLSPAQIALRDQSTQSGGIVWPELEGEETP